MTGTENGIRLFPSLGSGSFHSFLLCDRLIVETAMSEPIREDSRKRTLQIDGPTRLIRLDERGNEGLGRFKGTRITLFLSRGSREEETAPLRWEEIKEYLEWVCQDLPYRLNLEHVSDEGVTEDFIDPRPLTVELPPELEPAAVRIPIADEEFGLEGEVALLSHYLTKKAERDRLAKLPGPIIVDGEEPNLYLSPHRRQSDSHLLRGGFRVGDVPVFPSYSLGRLRLTWRSRETHRYATTNLARSAAVNNSNIADRVNWLLLSYLLDHVHDLPQGIAAKDVTLPYRNLAWLERYDALTIYQLARNGWLVKLGDETGEQLTTWEDGKGGSLSIDVTISNSLTDQLLALVLPRIAKLQMTSNRYYVKPPAANWRNTLEGCRDYITNPVRWGMFAEYVNPEYESLEYMNYRLIERQQLEELLYLAPVVLSGSFRLGERYFNSRFQERFATFDEPELFTLQRVLDKLQEAHRTEQKATLTRDESTVFQRAQDVAGDLRVSSSPFHSHGNSWEIGSIELPKISQT